MSQPIAIVDRGRGLQLSTSRITVQDLVPYFQDNCPDAEIIRWIPALTAEEIAVVRQYYLDHRTELDEQDRRIRERTERAIEEQRAKGLYPAIDESVPLEERIARLRGKLCERLAKQAGMALWADAKLDRDVNCADRPYLIPIPRQNHNPNHF